MQRSNTLNANKVVGADTGRGTEMLQFTAIKPDPEADNLRGLVATQSHSYNTMEHDLKPKLRDSSSPAPVVPKKEEHHPFSPENIRFFHEFHSQNALAQIQNSNVSSVTATIEAESIKSEPESYYGSPSSIDLQPNTATTRHPSRSITRHLDEHEHDVKPKLEELAHHSRLTAPRQEKTLQSYDRAGEPHHQSQMNGKLYDRSSSYIDRGVPPDPRHHVVKHERDTDEDDLGERPGMRMYSNGDSGSLSRSDRFHVGLHGDTKRVKTEHS
ncbi:hypothetical protein BDP27DRAFT_1033820 [Rhodocollybia butyracea]|uniref:Uncharacterized protein n=1 Tax=Rhodocollybia butyracea TaxID=206335 RepID=A0A9P5Q5I3_9AGAR|nr:hypothetical protein BDP27DRAFT_1033820 [Rhodocollybia butyracea]